MQATRGSLGASSTSSLNRPGASTMPSSKGEAHLSSSHISSPDDCPSSPPSSAKTRRFRLALHSTASAPPSSMGQNLSVPYTPSTSQRFKRAFSTRRKKTNEDDIYQEKDMEHVQSPPPTSSPPSSPPPSTRHFTLFGYRKPSIVSSPSPQSSPMLLPTRARSKSPSPSDAPVVINSSGVSASVQFKRQDEEKSKPEERRVARPVKKFTVSEQENEDWRKSDSTLGSYHTIRPDVGATRNPRPVSAAESSHSAITIGPVNKRVSLLVSDDGPVTTHEEKTDDEIVVSRTQPPRSPLKELHRRSVSMKLGSALSFKSKTSLSELRPETVDPLTASRSREPLQVSTVYTSAVNTDSAEGFIAPLNSPSTSTSNPPGNQIRGRFAAWTAAASSSRYHRTLPPTSFPQQPNSNSKISPTLRNTAVSISGNIAPSAMDLGKRAMEKMGRAWGSRSNAASSGYASSPGELLVSKRRTSEIVMSQEHAKNSIPSQISSSSLPRKGKRRTPDSSSATWSIASLSTTASDDIPANGLAGISSSKCLRGPLASSGLVFGRGLRDTVRDTAVDKVRLRLISGEYFRQASSLEILPLEDRLLPAVVVRCVQHLLAWGVQEEGLFRMNGRSSQIRDLRNEFDQGVDYDISGCEPCDIDPHVVSSLFKLYLRELPEPLLTHDLTPFFEAVLAVEDSEMSSVTRPSRAYAGMMGSSLPANVKSDLRKPPSLSTLAMPNLAAMRSASQNSVSAIASLIAQLPRENRDLLYTLTELMRATASQSKQTKMPLANLLLVFCPTLNMKPTLLRTLCESEDIWRSPLDIAATPIRISPVSMHSRESSLDSIRGNPDTLQVGPPVGTRRGKRRGPIATLYMGSSSSSTSLSDNVPPDMTSDTTYSQDGSSEFLSDVGSSAVKATRKDFIQISSSSMESLATPTSSEPSFIIHDTKEELFAPPEIVDHADLFSALNIKDCSVPFPSTFESLSPIPLKTRKSSPNISSLIHDPKIKRPSHPSLNALFSKKSGSAPSLRSFSSSISAPLPLQKPLSGFKDPRDKLTAPSLNTHISSSPIELYFEDSFRNKSDLNSSPTITHQSDSPTETESPKSSFYVTPAESDPNDKNQFSVLRSASMLSVVLGSDNPEDDWTKSVLQAVDIDHD